MDLYKQNQKNSIYKLVERQILSQLNTYRIVGDVNNESALIRVSSSNTWSPPNESFKSGFRRSCESKPKH